MGEEEKLIASYIYHLRRIEKILVLNWNEFSKESDRAAVILGVAKLENLLGKLLIQLLLPNPSNTDNLFDGENAPLSTFAAKINICHRLGLIDSEFAKCLHSIRRIRNDFAHDIEGADLKKSPYRDRANDVIKIFKNYSVFINFLEIIKKYKEEIHDFRAVLLVLIAMLDTLIDMGIIRDKYEKIKEKPSFSLELLK